MNYHEMAERGPLVRTERGSVQCFDFQGDTVIYDATNPEARDFIWQRSYENYYKNGIDMFWLDEAEPEYSAYDFDNYRYHAGAALKVSNRYPKEHARVYYERMKALGQTDIVNLMFYEFPEDERCWELDEQYMFGSKYLVAPVLYQGMTEREVYLPHGTWKSIHDGRIYSGNQTITAAAPLDIIPVYEKL